MIIIVGDSRVRHVEKAFGAADLGKLKPVFLCKAGARIPTILDLLKDFRTSHSEEPVLITIIGLIGDVLEKRTDENIGWPQMKIREEALKGKVYPAVEGALQMRQEVEEEIRGIWRDVQIVWILPFPVDLGTYVKSCATKPVPRHVECAANKTTLLFNNYMASMDKKFQRVEWDVDVIPWFNIWRDVSNWKRGTPDEFKIFMHALRQGDRVPSLYPESSLDGIHPQLQTSQGLIRAIVRKYRLTLSARPKTPKQVEKPAEVEAAASPNCDKAVQTDPKSYIALRTSSTTSIELPCGHFNFTVRDDGDLFMCNDCDSSYREDDLKFEVAVMKKITLKYRFEISRPSTSE